jgi:hypothetical protein
MISPEAVSKRGVDLIRTGIGVGVVEAKQLTKRGLNLQYPPPIAI